MRCSTQYCRRSFFDSTHQSAESSYDNCTRTGSRRSRTSIASSKWHQVRVKTGVLRELLPAVEEHQHSEIIFPTSFRVFRTVKTYQILL